MSELDYSYKYNWESYVTKRIIDVGRDAHTDSYPSIVTRMNALRLIYDLMEGSDGLTPAVVLGEVPGSIEFVWSIAGQDLSIETWPNWSVLVTYRNASDLDASINTDLKYCRGSVDKILKDMYKFYLAAVGGKDA